jgi:hypothetical protein
MVFSDHIFSHDVNCIPNGQAFRRLNTFPETSPQRGKPFLQSSAITLTRIGKQASPEAFSNFHHTEIKTSLEIIHAAQNLL